MYTREITVGAVRFHWLICDFNTCVLLTQGKSLSLICGALSWLTDHEEKRRQEAAALLQEGEAALSTSTAQTSTTTTSSSTAEPDWITDFVQKKAERDLVSKLQVRVSSYFRCGLGADLWEFCLLTVIGCFCVSGGRIEKKEEGRTIRNDQKQRSAKVCNEKKSKWPCTVAF